MEQALDPGCYAVYIFDTTLKPLCPVDKRGQRLKAGDRVSVCRPVQHFKADVKRTTSVTKLA